MFAKSFKLVFGIGAAIVATAALAAAVIGGFWLVGYLVTNPATEAQNDARRLAQAVRVRNDAREALCSELPAPLNRFVKYLDPSPGSFDMPGVKVGTVLSKEELAEAQEKALQNARNRVFVEKAREYCR